LCVLSVRW
ncbi:hypothetical protein D043_0059B, partial [Vibrio parahaemolyticus EKP-021]